MESGEAVRVPSPLAEFIKRLLYYQRNARWARTSIWPVGVRASTMASSKKRFGILVRGGPARGITGVIAAATIAACKNGFEVVGFMDGFKHLIKGDVSQIKMLTIQGVTRFF